MTYYPKRIDLTTMPEFRQILDENPELPVVFYGGAYANDCYCGQVNPRIGYVLSVATPYDVVLPDDGLFWDKEFFKDTVVDFIVGEIESKLSGNRYETVEAINRRAEKIVEEYDPFWVKVILVEVDA